MNTLVSQMNGVIADWKRQHDLLSAIASGFTVGDGWLLFDGRSLCAITDDLFLASAEFDAERIEFLLEPGYQIDLVIAWGEDLPPAVEAVSVVQWLNG